MGWHVGLAQSIYTFSSQGLTMILNAEQEEYLPFITDSAGLIVNIHSPDSQPWAREHGIIISPGFNTEIAVKIVSYFPTSLWRR